MRAQGLRSQRLAIPPQSPAIARTGSQATHRWRETDSNCRFRAKWAYGPTESEKQASQETTVSANSDAKDLVAGLGASGHRNRAPHDLEIGSTSEGNRSDARGGCHQRPASTSPRALSRCRPARTSPRTSRYSKSPSVSSSTLASPTAPISRYYVASATE
jgi:hypothetical protein